MGFWASGLKLVFPRKIGKVEIIVTLLLLDHLRKMFSF